ncbi:MAG: helicase-related protein [Solibacillus sp.]
MDFRKQINHFITSLSPTINTLYFFKGFSAEFYAQLLEAQAFPRFTDLAIDAVFYEETKPKQFMMALMALEESISWGTYEELLKIYEVVPNFSQIYEGNIVVVHNNLFANSAHSYAPQLQQALADNNQDMSDLPYDLFYSDYRLFDDGILVEYIVKHQENELGVPVEEVNFFTDTLPATSSEVIEPERIIEYELDELVHYALQGVLHNRYFAISPTNSRGPHLSERLDMLNAVFKEQAVHFILKNTKVVKKAASDNHLAYFQKHWGAESMYKNALFYEAPDTSLQTIEINQGDIISDILNQCELCRTDLTSTSKADFIITAPTGSGKSLFFQIPGIVLHEKYKEVTIVITPLQALMRDQVEKLQNERGVHFATFLNAEISFEERKSRIEGIHNGDYSIIYLSPELLLSSSIEDFIGERRIGLFVIDEAHLVTSWGRDFRVDYWFLGDFLNKTREGHYYSKHEKRKFPVLILTATAIKGGADDEIGDLIESLHLNVDNQQNLYIGYNRKENIHFDIVPIKVARGEQDPKEQLVLDRMTRFIENNEKTIIYCPYTSQVDHLYDLFTTQNAYVGKYHGKLSALEKEETYRNFKSGAITVILATKAFGMGIDIDDIVNVYHYAPTGTLSDYVQEIGRAARQLDEGFARMDYLVGKDTRYARTLWGLGGIKRYQLQEIANVLYKAYRKNNKRKLLISPESFTHIFDNDDVDAKVKSGLMLLTNDLQERYGFKAITIKPRAMYTSQYISLPETIKDDFCKRYGKYITPLTEAPKTRKETKYGKWEDVKITMLGEIYEIKLGELWEEQFDALTFPQFKYKFFKNELFDYKDRVIPKMRLTIDYSTSSYEDVKKQFCLLADRIQHTFLSIARQYNMKEFKFNQFYEEFVHSFDEKHKPKKEFVRLLLEMFCFNGIATGVHSQPEWRFVQKRKKENSIEYDYKLIQRKYNRVATNLKRYIGDIAPNVDGNQFTVFINIPERGQENRDYKLLCATILQLFELATYEVQGGKNAQIFVQISDPYKLAQIARSDNYRNLVLQRITKKHDQAAEFMNQFLSQPFTDEERWDIIEHFFLGRNEVVEAMLSKEPVLS